MFGFYSGIYKFNTDKQTTFQTLKDTVTTFTTTFSTSRSTTTTFNTTKTRNTIYPTWQTLTSRLTQVYGNTSYNTSRSTTNYPSWSYRNNAVEENMGPPLNSFYYAGSYRGQAYATSLTVGSTTYYRQAYQGVVGGYFQFRILAQFLTTFQTTRSTLINEYATTVITTTTNKTISTQYTDSTTKETTTTFDTTKDTSSTIQTLKDTTRTTSVETDYYE